MNLSDEQREAVHGDCRYLRVLASAGSGKTEVVAQRVERLLRAEGGFRVLALSYTRRAARELRDRFAVRLGDQRDRVDTDTLHGFARQLLLQYGTWLGMPADPVVVTDMADRIELFDTWRAGAGLPALEDTRSVLEAVDLARARRESTRHVAEWAEALSDVGALDYESMLVRTAELIDLPRVGRLVARLYRHVIIDEAQNLTASQYHLLTRLIRAGSDETHVVLVGDDKQSIVAFAGASPAHLESFASEFNAHTVRLTRNFRSGAAIVAIGDAISRDLGESQSEPQSYAAPGLVEVRELEDEEAEAEAIVMWVRGLLADGIPDRALAVGEDRTVRDREVAVLARSAWGLRACQRKLIGSGIAVAVATHADDWLTTAAAQSAWLLGTHRPDSEVSMRRLSRRIGSEEAESHPLLRQLRAPITPEGFVDLVRAHEESDEAWVRDQQEIESAWRAFCNQAAAADRGWRQFEIFLARWQRGDDEQVGVRLQTVHKAQGREYRAVAVVGLNLGQFPDHRANTSEDIQAEQRAFYVAVTRASRVLLLTRPRSILPRSGRPWVRDPSPFLAYAEEAN